MSETLAAYQSPFAGVLAPVITPFTVDLKPDPVRFARHCRWLLANGCSGLAIFGTNSEANSLSVAQKMNLLDALLDAGIDPLRLMPGAGSCSLEDAVRLSGHAVRRGCGGVLILPPFYYKGVSDDGLFAFFEALIARVGDPRLRLYLYHIPAVTAVPIGLELIDRLLDRYPKVICGMKDSSGDWDNTRSAIERFGARGFEVFAGNEDFLLRTMRAGGSGCITATGNINPAAIDALYRNWQAPDAEARQQALTKFRSGLQRNPMIAALKATVAHFSGDAEWSIMHPPLTALDSAQQADLRQHLQASNFTMPGLND